MPLHPPVVPASPAHLRRARAAVSTLFFLNAVLYANLVPRLPEIKDQLALSNAELGTAIAAMPVGALLAGLLAPALISRLGSARVASFGLIGLAFAVAAVPFAGAWVLLAGLLLVAGAFDAVVDVAQNAHGFRVQRAYGRSIVNSFHALWSLGAVLGGLLGSAAVGLDVPLGAHLVASAVVFSVVATIAYLHTLPGPEDTERVAADDAAGRPPAARGLRITSRRTLLLLAALGVLAACEAFIQDAASSWGALYMRDEVGADAATAGLAFVSLHVAMTGARLVGDRVVDRFGQRRVTRLGGGLVAIGMGLAVAVPTVATVLAGFALAGIGVATLVPAAMHAADELPGLPHGVGLTVVSWVLRAGFLVSPVVIGLLADATSLRAALLTVVVAGLTVLALGRVLGGRTTTASDRPAGAGQPPVPPGSAAAPPVAPPA